MQAVPSEVIEHPLDADTLSARWREILDDPCFANFIGKLDLDRWGRILVSPVNTEHGRVSARLAHLLITHLGGQAVVEVGVRTPEGIFAPDVAWCSDAFWQAHGNETPLQVAPEISVEVASPSNTMQDLREKAQAYLDAGAVEAWIVFPRSKRIEYRGRSGLLSKSGFSVDLATLFS